MAIHQDDTGTAFIITLKDNNGVVFDVSGASERKIFFRKPSGTIISKDMTLVTSGTDGKVRYVTGIGDIDEAGNWKMQVKITISGAVKRSNIYKFKVERNL